MALIKNGKYFSLPLELKLNQEVLKQMKDFDVTQYKTALNETTEKCLEDIKKGTSWMNGMYVYTYCKDITKATVFESLVPPEKSILNFTQEEMIEQLSRDLTDSQVLLETKYGETKKKLKYGYNILKCKRLDDELGLDYILNLNIDFIKYHGYINAAYGEFRESGARFALGTVYLQSLVGIDMIKDEGFYSPYAMNNKNKKIKAHITDKEAWDGIIKRDPLSILRKHLKFIIETN